MTTNNKIPIVFISSVVSTLERERSKALKQISSFGWTSCASGISDSGFGGGAEDGCYHAVENCDLCLAIFLSRSGSPSYVLESFVTEMEFQIALKSRRPLLIYILEDTNRPDEHLESFLDCMKTEYYVRICSRLQFKNRLSKDLEEFGRAWQAGDTDRWVPPLHLDWLLDHVYDAPLVLDASVNSHSVVATPESIEAHLLAMTNHYGAYRFRDAIAIGVKLMVCFHRLGLSYEDKPLVRLWARFLQVWSCACIWLGHIGGYWGALNSSLAMREAYGMLGDWQNFYESHGLVGNAYYVLASRMHVQETRLQNVRTFIDITERQRSALMRALAFDEFRAHRYSDLFPHFQRAYVNLELGDYTRAIDDFRTMLGYGDALDKLRHVEYVTGLGQSLVLRGISKELSRDVSEGRSLLRQAGGLLKSLPISPFYISQTKRIAKTYIRSGDEEQGKAMLQHLYPLALRGNLWHQAETINAQLVALDKRVR